MKKLLFTAMLFSSLCCLAQEESPETIVQKQVDAYNSRNIEAFLSFYADNARIYYYPDKLNLDGKEAMRKAYTSYFKNATSLNCRITKRIVRNYIVIDEEFVSYNGSESSGVAIYEIAKGKIVRVTFTD